MTLAPELEALGVGLVVTEQAIDITTPTGRLLFTVLGAIAEFERELIRERVIAGGRRAKALGIRCRRPRKYELEAAEVAALRAEGLSLSEIGRRLGGGTAIHPTVIRRLLEPHKTSRRALRIPAVVLIRPSHREPAVHVGDDLRAFLVRDVLFTEAAPALH